MDIARNDLRPILRASAQKSLLSVKLNGIHFTGSTSLYVQLEQVTYIGEIIKASKENSEDIIVEIVTDDGGRSILRANSYIHLNYFFKGDEDTHVLAYLTGSNCEVYDNPWWNVESKIVKVGE